MPSSFYDENLIARIVVTHDLDRSPSEVEPPVVERRLAGAVSFESLTTVGVKQPVAVGGMACHGRSLADEMRIRGCRFAAAAQVAIPVHRTAWWCRHRSRDAWNDEVVRLVGRLAVVLATIVAACGASHHLPGFEVRGDLTMEVGASVPGPGVEVAVLVTDGNGRVMTTTTNSKGAWSVRLAAGPYAVAAAVPSGLHCDTQSVTVRPGPVPLVHLTCSGR